MGSDGSQLEVMELVGHLWLSGLRVGAEATWMVSGLATEDQLGLVSTKPSLPEGPRHQNYILESAFPSLLEHPVSPPPST